MRKVEADRSKQERMEGVVHVFETRAGGRDPAVRIQMNLHRGFVRLGIGLVALWFVFWTCAYVMKPYTSLRPELASFAVRVVTWGVFVPCLIAALALGEWIAAGFRSD